MDKEEFEDLTLLRNRLMALNTKAIGLALGTAFGVGLFVITNWLMLQGGEVTASGEHVVGTNLALLGQIFPGYDVSFFGSLVGLLYGFAVGTLAGAGIGAVYNVLTRLRGRGSL